MALTKVPSELSSTPGIVDNSNSTAITIDSDENVTFSGAVTADGLTVDTSGQVIINHSADGGGIRIDSTNATNTGSLRFGDVADNYIGAVEYNHTNDSMSFYANNATRMTIDASGNLLVGKTAFDDGATKGFTHYSGSGDSATFITRSSNPPLNLSRLNSDGEILRIRKDGTTVGSIGTVSGGLYIASPVSSDSGLRFSGSTVHPCTTAGAPRDNAVDLGYAAGRFDDIFATNGTIQTSDRNEKQDIEALSDAEQRVAVAAKGLLRKFRWIDAVEAKGDDARIHFGIIAQDLQDAFTAEGLDAGRYAMFTSNTWTDEDTGEERTRLGVRYSELLAFIISAI